MNLDELREKLCLDLLSLLRMSEAQFQEWLELVVGEHGYSEAQREAFYRDWTTRKSQVQGGITTTLEQLALQTDLTVEDLVALPPDMFTTVLSRCKLPVINHSMIASEWRGRKGNCTSRDDMIVVNATKHDKVDVSRVVPRLEGTKEPRHSRKQKLHGAEDHSRSTKIKMTTTPTLPTLEATKTTSRLTCPSNVIKTSKPSMKKSEVILIPNSAPSDTNAGPSSMDACMQGKILKALGELYAMGIHEPCCIYVALMARYGSTTTYKYTSAIAALKESGVIRQASRGRLALSERPFTVPPRLSNAQVLDRIKISIKKVAEKTKAIAIIDNLQHGGALLDVELYSALGLHGPTTYSYTRGKAILRELHLMEVLTDKRIQLADIFFPDGRAPAPALPDPVLSTAAIPDAVAASQHDYVPDETVSNVVAV